MKRQNIQKSGSAIVLLLCCFLFSGCPGNDTLPEETSGKIRDSDDAKLVAMMLLDVMEYMWDKVPFGNYLTGYCPESASGSYSITGGASKSVISYTTEYKKNFTVTFNNYEYKPGQIIESGSISYKYADYSTSGYNLIILIKSTSDIKLKYQNGDYLIDDKIYSLYMGDIDNNRYMIGANFTNSEGHKYAVKAF
jgi:hypothetical protein